MATFFLDTAYAIALSSVTDSYHQRALEHWQPVGFTHFTPWHGDIHMQNAATNLGRLHLSSEQIEQFVRDGFVKVSGLIPGDVVAATRDALLEEHKRSGEPDAIQGKERFLRLLELTAVCRTEAMEEAARQLVGPHFLREVTYSPFLETLGAPSALYRGFIPVLREPQAGPKEFVPPNGYHIDGIHHVAMLPQSLCLVVFVYLTDVAEYGGATVILPGSHRQVFEHWYAQDTPDTRSTPPLPYAAPIPVAGKAGDTIFMHYLTVHSGSINRADTVRVGLNTSVVPDLAHPFVPRAGAPTAEWTPLERTLCTDTL